MRISEICNALFFILFLCRGKCTHTFKKGSIDNNWEHRSEIKTRAGLNLETGDERFMWTVSIVSRQINALVHISKDFCLC